jgi:hypothetical protein
LAEELAGFKGAVVFGKVYVKHFAFEELSAPRTQVI